MYDVQERTAAGAEPLNWQTMAMPVERVLPPSSARWGRSSAELVLPTHSNRVSDILLFLKRDAEQTNGTCSVVADNGPTVDLNLRPNLWTWRVLSVPPSHPPRHTLTLTFHATPPWDPKSKGFPNDLALLVAYAAVMPARDSKVGGGLTTPGAAESMQK